MNADSIARRVNAMFLEMDDLMRMAQLVEDKFMGDTFIGPNQSGRLTITHHDREVLAFAIRNVARRAEGIQATIDQLDTDIEEDAL